MLSAVFLDRDGVLNRMVPNLEEGEDSPHFPDDLELLPGAAAGVKALNDFGVPVVLVSNQPGIAKGKATAESLAATTNRLRTLLEQQGAHLDGVYYCLHHPGALIEEYRLTCGCRKPKPGLLVAASRDLGISLGHSVMVGDRVTDVIAGRSAGCRTVLIGARTAEADYVAADLPQAAAWIMARSREVPDSRLLTGERAC